MVPIILFMVVVTRFKRAIWRDGNLTFYLDARLLTSVLVAVSFLLSLYISAIIYGGPTYSRRDLEQVNDRIYILVERNTYDDLGFGSFILYRCDRFGIFCEKLQNTGIYDWGDWYDSVHLSSDPTTNTISILIDGEVVYTYPPSSNEP